MADETERVDVTERVKQEAERVSKEVEGAWHNKAVPVAVGTAGLSSSVLAKGTRWAIYIFPFAYIFFVGTVLAVVGLYPLEKRIELFLASDCGKLHQILFVSMVLIVIFVLVASASIIFAWDHVLWVKVLFPLGTTVFVVGGVVAWILKDFFCEEYFQEHAMGIWEIFITSVIILAFFACFAWYSALAKAPFVIEYEEIKDKKEDEDSADKEA
mmetsp:Transcript_98498/g.147653  ORF Transcript_98498/g.147653 Transcript_98498/m.147653 type:complete len:213 (+) Transcript_98498:142-780(+)